MVIGKHLPLCLIISVLYQNNEILDTTIYKNHNRINKMKITGIFLAYGAFLFFMAMQYLSYQQISYQQSIVNEYIKYNITYDRSLSDKYDREQESRKVIIYFVSFAFLIVGVVLYTVGKSSEKNRERSD